MGREDFSLFLKQTAPDDEEITTTETRFENNDITNGKGLTMMYLKNEVFLLTDVFQNYIDTCLSAYGINPLFS